MWRTARNRVVGNVIWRKFNNVIRLDYRATTFLPLYFSVVAPASVYNYDGRNQIESNAIGARNVGVLI